MLKGNAIVGQSGGPTTAINATLSGVIRGFQSAGIGKIFGAFNGVEGMLKGTFTDLTPLTEDDLKLLENTPAAALGSCRKKLPKVGEGDEVYEKLLSIFKKYDIRYFFYIGGNDSMDTVAKLSAYAEKCDYDMAIIGVPKTIDNDLVGTDHTPGFGSAAKYIATTMQEMIRDCAVYNIPAVTVVEIMGRDAGWLTAAAALPRAVSGVCPDLVYLPERDFDMETFLADVRACLARHPNVVVAVSEGIRFADGGYVGAASQSGATDAFGHQYLAGAGRVLERVIKNEIGCKVRSVELNLPQRCAAHLSSATDLDESVIIGQTAVKSALAGVSGHMMTVVRHPGDYRVEVSSSPVADIANMIKKVPEAYINEAGNHVTDECLAYLLPLIQGERKLTFVKGLPAHVIVE